ncbi:MAG: DUF975 family protein [Anaerovoracaceae bacterium]|jgi:uncharacterized membrane protein|nr:DUF975 family protein [Anaerovoracaceae bacterium]
MNIFIVSESSKNMRALGRMALETKRNTAMLVMLVYGVAVMLPPAIISILFGGTLGENMSLLYTLLVTGPFTYGLAVFFLATFRRQESEVQQVFEGFEKFAKTLGLFFYILLFVILWSLLFIIPGIIASFRYSQAFLIMVDHPEYTISQCVDESKMRMQGNKGKYFILGLSFIGWSLLCSIPLTIVEAMFTSSSSVVFYQFLSLVAMLPFIWLGAYMHLTLVAFYEILMGNLKAEPITPELPLEA